MVANVYSNGKVSSAVAAAAITMWGMGWLPAPLKGLGLLQLDL
jgi:hypothetical protein